jgi:hypothetical protein
MAAAVAYAVVADMRHTDSRFIFLAAQFFIAIQWAKR